MNLAKKAAAEAACRHIKSGMVVGLGTGSTTEFAIRRIAERVKRGLKISAVPTSKATEKLALSLGIPLVDYNEFLESGKQADIDIDGADCVDPLFRLIKGRGGAHTREKKIAVASKRFYCIVDTTKLVEELIGSVPIPVEVEPNRWEEVADSLLRFGRAELREKRGKVFITDNSNYILDLSPNADVGEPERLEVDINRVPGVVDNGLFTKRLPDILFVGHPDGSVRVLKNE